ncbi:hypothetical protein FQR65_LT19528 [Abscondita terminalis]|nr:hypothetical protein FQR65_LT19528 [Abscondita terminalis]
MLECLLKNEQFDLNNVFSVPLNVIEILFVTFEHCKHSNVFYKGLGNMKEILNMFKVAHSLHTKLLCLMEVHVHPTISSEEINIVLQFLVKIGKILSSTSMRAMADNWRGYIRIIQKFSDALNGSYNIKESLTALAHEIDKNLNSLLKDTKNLKSIAKVCNFLTKIIGKLCEVLLNDVEGDWDTVFMFLLNVYRYHPYLLRSHGLSNDVVREINEYVFNPLDDLLEKLCSKPEFCEMLIKCDQMRVSAVEPLLLIVNIFKKYTFLLKFNSNVSNIPRVIEIFFDDLSQRYFEFWKLIILEPSNQALYENNIQTMAQMFRMLPNKEYHKIECVLFKNIFNESVWNWLLAIDIWHVAVREDPQLCYETFYNVIKCSEVFLNNNFVEEPQLIVLANFLKNLGGYISKNNKQRLLNEYPIKKYLWRVLRIETFGSSIVTLVIEKSNLFITKKSTLEDFKDLCWGLDALSLTPNYDDGDNSLLTTALINMWTFIFNKDWRDSFYATSFIRKLFKATNNCIPKFNEDQLLIVLIKMKTLLDADADFKVSITLILSLMAKKKIKTLLNREELCTNVSEILIKLLACKNQIVQQNSLEVLVEFNQIYAFSKITENILKNDHKLRNRISNFINMNVCDYGTISSEEYFRLQSNYKYCHCCPQIKNITCGANLTNGEGSSVDLGNCKSDEIDNILKTIKTNISLFCKLSGKPSMADETTDEIMRILNR